MVGNGVAALIRSEATTVQPPLPPVLNAELGAGLVLDLSNLPAAAVSTFKHAASIANPKFYELQRLRKSTWDTPRFVRGYDITLDDRLGPSARAASHRHRNRGDGRLTPGDHRHTKRRQRD